LETVSFREYSVLHPALPAHDRGADHVHIFRVDGEPFTPGVLAEHLCPRVEKVSQKLTRRDVKLFGLSSCEELVEDLADHAEGPTRVTGEESAQWFLAGAEKHLWDLISNAGLVNFYQFPYALVMSIKEMSELCLATPENSPLALSCDYIDRHKADYLLAFLLSAVVLVVVGYSFCKAFSQEKQPVRVQPPRPSTVTALQQRKQRKPRRRGVQHRK